MASITSIRSKLAKVVAMLSSDNDGDRRNAWRALDALLKGAGCTFVDLAAVIDPEKSRGAGAPSAAELNEFYQAAFADGQKSVQGQQTQPYEIDWRQIAEAVAPHVDELNARDQEFVKGVIIRIRLGREPTEKQAKWFKDIYLKLGRVHGFAATPV
jgi:hypothetical protein